MSGPTVGEVGEHALIARIRDRLPPAPSWVAVGIGDDAAAIVPARNALDLLSTDVLVESVHFDLAFVTPADVGYKALAVNLSDLAAMGAAPRAALLSLLLPADLPAAGVDALLDGFLQAAGDDVPLVGGNIARSPGPLCVDVTVVGASGRRKALLRSGGRPGDELFVTGALGAAAAGLGWLQADAAGAGDGPSGTPDDPALAECVARYRRPATRLRIGLLLGRNRAASACIDLSDGLGDGVARIAAGSGVGARIEADALPIHAGARAWFDRRGADPVLAAVSGGEDYELLLAVPRRHRGRLAHVRQQARGVPITRIGVLTAEPHVVLRREGEDLPLPGGYVHF